MIKRYRDLSLIEIGGEVLVIANDSSCSIGSKEYDFVKTSPENMGYYASQVPLMEVLAYGAEPILMIDNLTVEYEPTGKRVIQGVKKAIESIGMDPELMLNGSTEENFKSVQTGIGLTVIGKAASKEIPLHKTSIDEIIVSLGHPLLGNEILDDRERTIMNARRMKKLRSLSFVNNILPVGSKGIMGEIINFEKESLKKLKFFETDIDMKKSGGTSTVVLASILEKDLEKLRQAMDVRVEKLASFK